MKNDLNIHTSRITKCVYMHTRTHICMCVCVYVCLCAMGFKLFTLDIYRMRIIYNNNNNNNNFLKIYRIQ